MKVRTIINARNGLDGNISMVLLDGNTRYTSLKTAINMTEKGRVGAVLVTRDKKRHMRSMPDGKKSNNL
ncbi:MAG: hypothetical protein COA78_36755, partial [Blastopirellula sp.]